MKRHMAVRLVPNARTMSTPFRAKSSSPGSGGAGSDEVYEGIEDSCDSKQYDPLSSLECSARASFTQSFGAGPRVADHERAEKNEQDEQQVRRAGVCYGRNRTRCRGRL